MAAISVKIPIEHLGDEVLLERHFKRVDFDEYWNSHGNKIYHDSHPCRKFTDCDVKIVNHKQIAYGNINWDYWEVFIDGVSYGSCEGYRARKTVCHIEKPWGAG
jgi:hypothetical protein